jgi:hypothetical protein
MLMDRRTNSPGGPIPPADQFPCERTVDDGIVIGYHPRQGYLIALKQHRENLYFKRRDLSPVHGG